MLLKPDFNLNKIYDIPVDKLKNLGIEAILLDLDSTVMISKSGEYLPETLEWFTLLSKDFKLAIVSNNKNPQYIEKVKKATPFPVIANACKPKTNGIREALEILQVDSNNAVMVGDRPLTDILAGKNAQTKTILVNSINYEQERKIVHFVRWLERLFIRNF